MPRTAKSCLTALGLALCAASANAAFQAPKPFSASYALRKGPLTLARAETELARPGDGRYVYRMHTQAVGITRLFYSGEIKEQSKGVIRAGGFRPTQYRYKRYGDDHVGRAVLDFDWAEGVVVNRAGDHPWRLAIPPGTIDRVITPLQLMHDLSVRDDGQKTLTYRIADDGELKKYTARVAGEETVTTPAGRFRALKVVRRAADDERRMTLWCVPELDYFTVRIERWDKDDGTFNLVLRSARGIDLAEARLADSPADRGGHAGR